MPSLPHEAVLELFRRRPSLALEIIRDAGLAGWNDGDLASSNGQVADSSLGDLVPTERKADLVLLFGETGGRPERVLIVEVQLAVDAEKRRSWWWYVVAAHTRHRCDAVLVVVTMSATVAAWAARPLTLGHPGASLTPVVIGPDAVPVVRDDTAASTAPELAVLSAIVHGHSTAGELVGRAAIAAVRGLDGDRAALYTDVVFASVHAAARAILEGLMANGTYEYQSDFALRYVEEGRTEAQALAVLTVLAARGIEVPHDARGRVLACRDVAALESWLRRAATADTLGDVLET